MKAWSSSRVAPFFENFIQIEILSFEETVNSLVETMENQAKKVEQEKLRVTYYEKGNIFFRLLVREIKLRVRLKQERRK